MDRAFGNIGKKFSPVFTSKNFEIGKVFIKNKPGMRVKENSDELLPAQPTYLGLAYSEKGVDNPFYTLSEAIISVLKQVGCVAELKPATHERQVHSSWPSSASVG